MHIDRYSSKELSGKEPDRECAQPQFRVQCLCACTGVWKQMRGVANNSFYQQVTSGQLIFSPPLLSQSHTDSKTQTTPTQSLQLTCIPSPPTPLQAVTTSIRVYPKERSWYSIIPQTYKENKAELYHLSWKGTSPLASGNLCQFTLNRAKKIFLSVSQCHGRKDIDKF